MIDAGTDKGYRSNVNKMVVAIASKKKDGSYTLNNDKVKDYAKKRSIKAFKDKKNFKKLLATRKNKEFNDKYGHLNRKFDRMIADREKPIN